MTMGMLSHGHDPADRGGAWISAHDVLGDLHASSIPVDPGRAAEI